MSEVVPVLAHNKRCGRAPALYPVPDPDALGAQRIIPELESKEKPALAHDSSTNNLIYQYRKSKKAN